MNSNTNFYSVTLEQGSQIRSPHVARLMCLCGPHQHQNTVDFTLNYGLRHFLAPIVALGHIFSPNAAIKLFFLQNLALVWI